MQWVITTGATVEEAKARALDALGIDDGDLEFTVLDEPGSALFGLRRTEARIRARVRPTRPRPKVDRRNRRKGGARNGGRSGGRSKGRRGGGGKDDRSGETAEDPRPEGGGRSRSRRSRRGGGGATTREASEAAGRSGDEPATGDADRRGRGRTDGRTPDGAASEVDEGRPAADPATGSEPSGPRPTAPRPVAPRSSGPRPDDADVSDDTPPRTRAADDAATGQDLPSNDQAPERATTGADMSDISLEEQQPSASAFLEGLLEAFGAEASVASEIVDDGDTLEITVEGEDLGLLVGQRGATLNALQELTRTAVAQQHSGRLDGRLRVDVAGYRARRKEALVRFTTQQAARVLESGARIALEPMSPPDRKIVHDAVNEIDGVRTVSEGEDRRRHVVLLPDD